MSRGSPPSVAEVFEVASAASGVVSLFPTFSAFPVALFLASSASLSEVSLLGFVRPFASISSKGSHLPLLMVDCTFRDSSALTTALG